MALETSISPMESKHVVDGKPYVINYLVARASLSADTDLRCNQDPENCNDLALKRELVQFNGLTNDGVLISKQEVLANLDEYPVEIQEIIRAGAPVELLWCMRHYIAACLG